MSPGAIFSLLKDTFKEWSEDKASRLGAALAYYTIFSIGPLLLIVIAVVGFVYGKQAAQGEISNLISARIGSAGAKVIEMAIQNAG